MSQAGRTPQREDDGIKSPGMNLFNFFIFHTVLI